MMFAAIDMEALRQGALLMILLEVKDLVTEVKTKKIISCFKDKNFIIHYSV
jgi:hypothetical protein